MDGSSVGHQAKGVLKNATGVEERQGNTHDALQLFLCPTQPGSSGVLHLVKHFILPEREGWHQMSSADSFAVALGYVTDERVKRILLGKPGFMKTRFSYHSHLCIAA